MILLRFSIFMVILAFAFTSFSQKVEVKEGTLKIAGKTFKGYESQIFFPKNKVESSWLKYQRNTGKTSREKGYFILHEVRWQGIYSNAVKIYSKLREDSASTIVSMALDPDTLDQEVINRIVERSHQYLYDFSIKVYRDEAQKRIEEAERGVVFTSKKYQQYINEGEDLQKDLQKNYDDSVRLVNEMKENMLEKEDLLKAIEDNKSNQDTTYLDLEKIKGVLERRKGELEEIH